jgi:hypothetical protein
VFEIQATELGFKPGFGLRYLFGQKQYFGKNLFDKKIHYRKVPLIEPWVKTKKLDLNRV